MTGGRALLVAALCLGIGLPGFYFSFRTLARAVRFRFTRGKPYIPGSASRATVNTALFGALLLAGLIMGGALWLTGDFQPVRGTSRAGWVRVTEDPTGSLLLEFRSDPALPGDPMILAAGLNGNDWLVTGEVLTFPGWLAPAGLDACHRVTQAGSPGGPARPLPNRAEQIAERLKTWPTGVQGGRRSLAGNGPLPAWTSVRVSRDGYTLGKVEPPSLHRE